jgi:hypothetical protein
MDIYSLSRNFWDYAYENPEIIKPNHCALYFFVIEHCNRLGWKQKFLKKYCTHVSRYIWAKVDQKPVQTNWIYNVQKSPEDEIEKAIALLKSTNNFKIMRRVSDWNEI